MKFIFKIKGLPVCCFLFLVIYPVFADPPPPDSPVSLKTRQIVEAAYKFTKENSSDMQKVQKALQTDSRFFDNDLELYIFMHAYSRDKKEAVVCAHAVRPELIGKNMWHLRTPNGRQLFAELTDLIEEEGEGWLEYEWLNPFTNKIQTKVSFIKGIVLNDGRTAWIGCGFWQ